MRGIRHKSKEELEEGLPYIMSSPKSVGKLDLIVRRPQENKREVMKEAELDLKYGLFGDSWINRSSSRTDDGGPHPDMQLNIMNSRAIRHIAGGKENWKWAGDQLYVDLDLSSENLAAGTQLKIGNAIIEITAQPHNGCKKFVARFGLDAMKFVNAKEYKHLHLRGINAKVIKPGNIKEGQIIEKL